MGICLDCLLGFRRLESSLSDALWPFGSRVGTRISSHTHRFTSVTPLVTTWSPPGHQLTSGLPEDRTTLHWPHHTTPSSHQAIHNQRHSDTGHAVEWIAELSSGLLKAGERSKYCYSMQVGWGPAAMRALHRREIGVM